MEGSLSQRNLNAAQPHGVSSLRYGKRARLDVPARNGPGCIPFNPARNVLRTDRPPWNAAAFRPSPSPMNPSTVVIGAGVGGLTGALRLAGSGFEVRVLEARPESGGLASGVHYGGFDFDAGPYILLDRPGLEWAFEHL